MKKRWFVIPVVAGLTALVVTGGAIFAHGNGPGPSGKGAEVTTRVAEILGLEPAVVQDAFQQAIEEQHDAALQERLAQMVENERITQADADAILAWHETKPIAASRVPGIMFMPEETLQHILNRLVEAERITQQDADGVMAWYQDRPAVLDDLPGFHRKGFHGQFRGHSQEQFRERFQRRMRPEQPGMPGLDFSERGNTDDMTYQQSFRSVTPELSNNSVLQ